MGRKENRFFFMPLRSSGPTANWRMMGKLASLSGMGGLTRCMGQAKFGWGSHGGDLQLQPVTSSQPLSVTPTVSVVTDSGCRPETYLQSPSSNWVFVLSLGFLIFESSLCFYFSLYFSFFVSVSIVPCLCFSVNCLMFFLHFTHISLNNKPQYCLHYWNPKQSKTKTQKLGLFTKAY